MEHRVPINGSMELDLRCNLRCLHCYRDGEWPPGILETDEIVGILDQVARAGTIFFLFTGGEIFLRRDFFEIYDEARRRGLLVTLFTNATMITPSIADRLAENPPYGLEITLYGFSKGTYERVTGVEGSREKCYRGVELLLERNVRLTLKTVVMRTNRHEFMDMFHFAEERGIRFRWDTQINPNFNGSQIPCNVRLSPEEVVDLEFSVPQRVEDYRRLFEPRKDLRTSRVFPCGAGTRTFNIDAYGNMKMCVLMREPEYSLRRMSFAQIWNEMFPPAYSRMRPAGHPCNSCNLASLCGKCAAWSLMEKGDAAARVEYSCEIGHRRAQKLGVWDGPVDQYSSRPNEVLLPVLGAQPANQARVAGGCP
jgi:radical SAM protein with 4Fe4S-binding SPASM domain